MDKETKIELPGSIIADAENTPSATSERFVERTSRAEGLLRGLNRLRVLIPAASGALRMVDHGAVQAVAKLLPLLDGSVPQSRATEAVQQGFAEIQQGNSDLSVQMQGQAAQMKRIQTQIEELRGADERHTARDFSLMEDIKSLRRLVRGLGIAAIVLLGALIAMTGDLLFHLPR